MGSWECDWGYLEYEATLEGLVSPKEGLVQGYMYIQVYMYM